MYYVSAHSPGGIEEPSCSMGGGHTDRHTDKQSLFAVLRAPLKAQRKMYLMQNLHVDRAKSLYLKAIRNRELEQGYEICTQTHTHIYIYVYIYTCMWCNIFQRTNHMALRPMLTVKKVASVQIFHFISPDVTQSKPLTSGNYLQKCFI